MTIKKGTVTIASEVPATDWGSIEGTLSDQTDLQNALNAKASTLSPSFTGIPTVPLAEEGTDNNQIASTKFVNTAIDNALDGANVLPDQTGQAGKVLTTDGSNASWTNYESAPSVDNVTTTLNSSDEIQAIGVIEKNTSSVKYDWVGTYAQWVAGRENHTILDSWICYITDDVVETKVAHNIGDVFYSLRLDDYLNGAVACDGSSYNTEDYSEGAQSIKNLLDSDKLPYVSISDFDATVTANGSCRCFGYDGGSTFKVPKLNDVFIESGSANTDNEFIDAGLPNITGGIVGLPASSAEDALTGSFYANESSNSSIAGTTSTNVKHYNLLLDASRSSSIYGNSLTVQPDAVKYRAFIQLVTGVSENAIQTIDVLADDVDDLKDEIQKTVQYKNITNCITEIPQNIKLELNDGTLTLKSGSIVTAPDGTQLQVTADKTLSGLTGTYKLFVYPNKTNASIGNYSVVSRTGSGATLPADATNYSHFFNTTDNKMYGWNWDTSQWVESNVCFPICIISLESDVITSIDQVFNGFGYIGSTMFVLPGVKGLAPNGRNTDGTLNNTEITVTSVQTINFSGIFDNCYVLINSPIDGAMLTGGNKPFYYDKDIKLLTAQEATYNEIENRLYRYGVAIGAIYEPHGFLACTFSTNSNYQITNFKPKTTFHAVDNNDFKKIKQEVEQKQDSATAVSYKNITNCITEIPQDIKLELNDGTLTLKAGSKVYVPNGFEEDGVTPKFDTITINSDATRTETASHTITTFFCFYRQSNNTIYIGGNDVLSSGTTTPVISGTYAYWYDTTNNLIKRTDDGGSTWTSGYSLPYCIITVADGTISNIDQVFNGFGYIGSTTFALPGVKVLVPNGRNEDGALNNVLVSLTEVKTFTEVVNNVPKTYITMNANGTLAGLALTANGKIRKYDEEENLVWNESIQKYVSLALLGTYTIEENSKIMNFNPKTPFHSLDWNDKRTIAGWSMPSGKYIDLTLDVSGTEYTAPANGYVVIDGQATDAWSEITLDNRGSAGTSNMTTSCYPRNNGQYLATFVPVKKDDRVYYYYSNITLQYFRFIYAEGEV